MSKPNRFLVSLGIVSIAYLSACLLLFIFQRQLIYRPSSQIAMLPSASEFKMPFQEVSIPVGQDRIYAWWIPAPSNQEQFTPIANEPTAHSQSSQSDALLLRSRTKHGRL